VKMHDTRPVTAMLRDLTGKLKWLSLMPNVKDVEGTMELGFDRSTMAVEDLVLTGKGLEVLGWVHILDKKPTGRIFARRGALSAGIALDDGKRKVVVAKPRTWFEGQRHPPTTLVRPAEDGSL